MARVHTIPISNAPLAHQHDLYVNYATHDSTFDVCVEFVSVPTGVIESLLMVRWATGDPPKPPHRVSNLPPLARIRRFERLCKPACKIDD